MNLVILVGRLTRDPELRNTSSGTEVANFTVAVDRFAKKGEDNQCDFIDCVAWRQSGVFVNTYFHKGDGIIVEGRLESRKWQDKDGNNRVSWEVVCDNVAFPPSKKNNNGGEASALGVIDGISEILDDTGELPF